MNWYVVWTAWLLAIAGTFAALEGYALATGGITLSRFTAIVSYHWPLIPVLYGGIFIGLAVHFWWHWDPHLPG